MSGYTPGPWVVLGTQGYEGVADIGDSRGEMVAQVACPSVERRNANTHLIAAAPDLLEAAVDLIAHVDGDPDDELNQYTYEAAWNALEAAVEKAV